MRATRARALLKRLIDDRIQALAVDANMHDMYGARYSQAVAASKERREMRELLELVPGIFPAPERETK